MLFDNIAYICMLLFNSITLYTFVNYFTLYELGIRALSCVISAAAAKYISGR